ncbi:TcmI family type II polyketide cyclase [Streptomyces sp. WAC 06738]|uniref:TcmI family type II polyketide cyclase n=1 Tax=Streptomyces sp. WAC 06738 TaxID=2203210 RepID=UPI000F6D56CC|nr:TcmI family type II polyketide cyclase [Streptomyces sp. WAC 06738]AZM50218.1 TcmI family type II polyketide cyclase [Streptomyces sp. WAC 06738]
MAYRALMVLRMNPADAPHVAAAFAEHDETVLPREIGVRRRVLFRFHDLYMHLIEADDDIMDRLYRARSSALFQQVNERVGRFLTPYDAAWKELKDSRADIFYTWEADTP